jgi:hypothetical protein
MAIKWIERPRGITPVDAWVYCDDLGNGWEIYGDIEPFSVSGLFGWVVIWRPLPFLPDNPAGVHVELRVEGAANTADEAKAKATQAIERLQAMAAADPQMLIRLQSPAGGV